jgi:hypothetical protein
MKWDGPRDWRSAIPLFKAPSARDCRGIDTEPSDKAGANIALVVPLIGAGRIVAGIESNRIRAGERKLATVDIRDVRIIQHRALSVGEIRELASGQRGQTTAFARSHASATRLQKQIVMSRPQAGAPLAAAI